MMVVTASRQASAQNKTALKQIWQTLQPDSCPHLYNFHLHTTHSDGQLKPTELIEQAVNIGLKGMAITDHHTTEGYQIAQKYLEHKQTELTNTPLPHLWTGVEVSAQLLATEVHILGYAFNPDHPSMQPYIQGKRPSGAEATAEVVIDSMHQAGGLVVLAHPARYRRSAHELIAAVAKLGIDGVESYYAYHNPKPWQPSPKETVEIRELSQVYGLLSTCGTDTHGRNILERV